MSDIIFEGFSAWRSIIAPTLLNLHEHMVRISNFPQPFFLCFQKTRWFAILVQCSHPQLDVLLLSLRLARRIDLGRHYAFFPHSAKAMQSEAIGVESGDLCGGW
jgi:hypothetical protein